MKKINLKNILKKTFKKRKKRKRRKFLKNLRFLKLIKLKKQKLKVHLKMKKLPKKIVKLIA